MWSGHSTVKSSMFLSSMFVIAFVGDTVVYGSISLSQNYIVLRSMIRLLSLVGGHVH